ATGPLGLEGLPGFELHHHILIIEYRTGGIAALGDNADLLLGEAAQERDALVAGGEVLLRVQRDRPLAGLRLVVAGKALVLLGRELGPRSSVHLRAEFAELAFL